MRFMQLRNKAVNCEIKSSRRGIIVALKNVVSCHKRFGGYCSTVTTRERTKIRWISSRDLSRILWIQSNSSDCEAFKQATLVLSLHLLKCHTTNLFAWLIKILKVHMVSSESERLFGLCKAKVTQYCYTIASTHHNDLLLL